MADETNEITALADETNASTAVVTDEDRLLFEPVPLKAKMNTSLRSYQFLLYALNVLFVVSGFILVTFGIWRLVAEDSTMEEYEVVQSSLRQLRAAGLCMIIVGVVSVYIGLGGCFFVYKQRIAFVYMIPFVLAALLTAEIILVGLAVGHHGQVVDNVEESISSMMKYEYGTKNDTNALQWDNMQATLGCCGLQDPSDWKDTAWFNMTGNKNKVPLSCCPLVNATESTTRNVSACLAVAYVQNATARAVFIHTKGCGSTVEDWLMGASWLILRIAITVLVLELIVVVVSLVMHFCLNLEGLFIYNNLSKIEAEIDAEAVDKTLAKSSSLPPSRAASRPTSRVPTPAPTVEVSGQPLSRAFSRPTSRVPSPIPMEAQASQPLLEVSAKAPSREASRPGSRVPSPVPQEGSTQAQGDVLGKPPSSVASPAKERLNKPSSREGSRPASPQVASPTHN